MDGKTKAIVAHITLIGWIIALVLNSQEKDEYASFYIRQMLGLMIAGFVGWLATIVFAFIPILGIIVSFAVWIVFLVLWIISLVGAASGQMKPLPVLGQQFQEWFKSL